ncbi:hypothetical protein FLK61_27430 [Paenalkalicoccus suaedae]|uniref:Uncharacterized protein n=1 Tax=Paenalkalicoccus suaedae TaxID=2592382 RepID=A0A859FBR3_9BACI|nr:hypothetical protein [Paenalkalicoccus suaedae]QKS70487.1 hypothetical protein FLK61_27430 [Paenalkalicoccus suaedae]
MKKAIIVGLSAFAILIGCLYVVEWLDNRELDRLAIERRETRTLYDLMTYTNKQLEAESMVTRDGRTAPYSFYVNFAYNAFLTEMFSNELNYRHVFEDSTQVMGAYNSEIANFEGGSVDRLWELTNQLKAIHDRSLDEYAEVDDRIESYWWRPF